MFDPQMFRFDDHFIPEKYIEELITVTAQCLNLTEWTLESTTFEHSQNYFGVLIPVVLKGKIDDEQKVFPLLLKLAPTEDSFRVSGAMTVMFKNELYAYFTLLKKYKELQDQFKLSHPLIVPEFYYGREELNKEAIVLKNMAEDGFKPYVSNMFLDYEHMIVSLKALASFHALSFILRTQNSQFFNEAAKVFVPINREQNKRFMEVLIDRLLKAIVRLDSNPKYVPFVSKLHKNCMEEVEATFSAAAPAVFCHGDMWKENLIFKYDKAGRVSAVCIVDFQNVRLSSPAFDVLYLIVSSTTSELRNKNYHTFINTYYDSFENSIKEAGLQAKDIYSKKAFEKDLKTVAPACLIVANTALWLSCGLQEDGHVRSKRIFHTPEEKIQANEFFISLITAIIEDYRKYGYITLCECSEYKSPYI